MLLKHPHSLKQIICFLQRNMIKSIITYGSMNKILKSENLKTGKALGTVWKRAVTEVEEKGHYVEDMGAQRMQSDVSGKYIARL